VARRQRKQPLEEFAKDNADLAQLLEDDVSLSEFITYIVDNTGCSYEELGNIMGLGKNQVGRLARGDSTQCNDKSLFRLCENLNLPFERVVYANTIGTMKKEVPDFESRLADLNKESDHSKIIPGEGVIISHEYIMIDSYAAWNNAKTVDEKLAVIEANSCHEDLHLGFYAVSKRPDIFYTRHVGPHMVSEKSSDKIIPDRSVIEVQIMPEDMINDGDVVLVQIGDRWATSYMYGLHSTRGVEHEDFRSAKSNHPLRVLHARHNIDPPLKEQRIIFGRVNRIVHLDLIS